MSLIDRILGRAKETVGESVDDPALRRAGSVQERNGEAQEELGQQYSEYRRRPNRSQS